MRPVPVFQPPVNRDGGGLASNDVWVDARELVLVPAGTNGYATDTSFQQLNSMCTQT